MTSDSPPPAAPPGGTDPGPADRPRSGWADLPPWLWRGIVLFWLGYVVVYVGTGLVRSLRSLLIVVAVSLFLSFAIEPAVNRMETWGIRRGIGTGIVFVAILVGAGGFSFLVGQALATQLQDFADRVPAYVDDLERWLEDVLNTDVDLTEVRDRFVNEGGAQDLLTNFADDIVNIGTTVVNLVFQLFTVALFTFYLVAEGPQLRRAVCSVLAPDRQRQVLAVWDLAIEKTGGYIYSRLVLAVLSGIAHWIAFTLLDVPFPVPLALWVGVVSQFIPVVGTYIAGALPVLVALLSDPATGLWALVFIVVYQQIENYLFAPGITAHTMEIHVAVAFGAVIAGGSVLGIVGALLA
ncbi:MAG: AI-2E family transporter, partial [Actinomyces sp.]